MQAKIDEARRRGLGGLAIGDSITTGVGGGPGVDYPAYLGADLRAYWGEAAVINDASNAPG